MDNAARFLDLILPANGVYAVVRRKMVHEWVTSTEDMAARLLAYSAKGEETYHGCASYKVAGSRKQANISLVKAFWLDLDCGEGKPYPSQRAAAEALVAFYKSVGLPVPIIVNSGRGLHVYWPIQAPLAGDVWRVHAQALKELTVRHGLKADPARTADSSSILRTPGTRNYKKDPLPVKVEHWVEAYPNDVVLSRLGAQSTVPTVDIGSIHSGEGRPSYAENIAPVCPQLKNIRDTQGNVPEPLWYAGLTVLARCADGDKLAHEWSRGHPDYSPGETDRKLAHAKEAPGPATCDTFASHEPSLCQDCPNKGKVKSPIVLGMQGGLDERNEPPQVDAPLPSLPKGFVWGARNALCAIEVDKLSGTKVTVPIYPYPVYLVGIREGETTFKTQYVIRHWAPGVGWRTFAIAAMEATGQHLMGHLATYGVKIAPWDVKRMADYLHLSIADAVERQKRETGYEQFGWKPDGSFVYGLRIYAPDGSVTPIGGSVQLEQRGQLMEPRGTLDGWREAAMLFFRQDMQPLAFTLLCGFASPLMHFTNSPGAIVSLVGETGSGKSQSGMGCVSVWGAEKALVFRTNDTINARFNSFGCISNLPLVIDDAHKMSEEQAQAYALNFTDGRDKLRSSVDGSVRLPASSWSTILIATCNSSLVEKVGTPEDARRIFEFNVPKFEDRVTLAEGERQLRQLWDNCGTAGDFFIRRIVLPQNREMVGKLVKAMLVHYSQKLGSRPEDRFWVRLLACVAAAARLVNALGILTFDERWVMDWALSQVEGMKHSTAASTESHINVIARFIDSHPMNTLVTVGDPDSNRKYSVRQDPRQAMIIRKELDSNGAPRMCYVEQKAIREWLLKQGGNPLDVKRKALADRSVVNTGRLFVLGKGTDYAGGQVKVWEVDMTHPAFSGLPAAVKLDKVG